MRTILFVILLVLPIANALSQGYMTGIIVTDDGSPLPQANVRIFNAVNAEIVDQTATDNAGSFTTGPISPGTYKVRIDRINYDDKDQCVGQFKEYLGEEIPDSSGSTLHADVFDTAKTFTIVDGAVTQVTGAVQEIRCSEIILCVNRFLDGVIVDKDTGEFLNGIAVKVKDPVNAMPESPDVASESNINGDGNFRVDVSCHQDGKVRFFDPNGQYAPEYYQDREDNFSLGDVVTYTSTINFITVYLSKASPPQQIQNLSDQISNLTLTDQTANNLTNSLGQAKTLLEDENPNNDKSACGLIKAFINKLDGLVASGEITSVEQDNLTNEASVISHSLDCK